jgi:MFS family permease
MPGDIFFGLLVFGLGVGLAFVTASIAALAGVPERESGVASGLSNTSFQIGAALGVAIVTTVAVTRTNDYLPPTPAPTTSSPSPKASSAFLAVAILAATGAALALLLRTGPHQTAEDELEPVSVTAGD